LSAGDTMSVSTESTTTSQLASKALDTTLVLQTSGTVLSDLSWRLFNPGNACSRLGHRFRLESPVHAPDPAIEINIPTRTQPNPWLLSRESWLRDATKPQVSPIPSTLIAKGFRLLVQGLHLEACFEGHDHAMWAYGAR
jgi:hypothetical protein